MEDNSFDHFINEGKKVTFKRRYTENHPALTAGASARIRNKVLEAIADGKISQEEFDAIISELSNDSSRWVKRNSKYFNVSEDGISLSKFGMRIFNQIKINENNQMKNNLVFESFSDFVSYNENGVIKENQLITEGTRGQFGIIDKKGNITSVYTHYDSYPDWMLPTIKKHYKNAKAVKAVVDKGGSSGLDAFDKMNFYNDGDQATGKKSNIKAYLSDVKNDGWAEFVYLYDEADKKWYMADTSVDRDLKPAFESFIAESKEEDEAYNIMQDLLGEWDPMDLEMMDMDQAEETVDSYGHKGSKAKKIAQYLVNMAQSGQFESVEVSERFKGKDLKEPALGYIYNKAGTQVQVVKMVDRALFMSYPSLKDAIDKKFNGQIGVNLVSRFKDQFDVEEVEVGGIYDVKESVELEEGNAFGDAVRKAKEAGEKEFEFEGETYKVEEMENFFVDSEEMVTEAFKSSKLRNLVSMDQAGSDAYGKSRNLAAALYGLSKIKLDTLEDSALVDMDPNTAYKQYANNNDYVVFYIVDNETENPYADRNSYRQPILKPGILALSRGKNFLGVEYNQRDSRGYKDPRGNKSAYTLGQSDDGVGGNKKYRGYDASGLSSIKRVAELADRAIAFNIVSGGESARDLIQQRSDAQSGAIAFKSAADFKKANQQRYKDILATKASKLPLDKIVEDAINTLSSHIADAMKRMEKTQYNEIKIGEDKRGRDIKLTDASNIMSSILSDYERYVSYMANAEKEKESGYSSGYYERESKEYAKRVADRAKKVKDMDYAW